MFTLFNVRKVEILIKIDNLLVLFSGGLVARRFLLVDECDLQLNLGEEFAFLGAQQFVGLNQRGGEHMGVGVVENAHANTAGVRIRQHCCRCFRDAVLFTQAPLYVFNIFKNDDTTLNIFICYFRENFFWFVCIIIYLLFW